jgi:NAD(P)-dependent dehydrogenase (short-subunit alcohol dehydrogenase family)
MNPSVLVTGGARRIGRRICEVLSQSGWNVVIHSRGKDDADAAELAEKLHSPRVWGDLGDEREVRRIFENAAGAAPSLCAVVNNASVFSVASVLGAEETAKIRNVNFASPVLLTELLHGKCAQEKMSAAAVNLLDTRILPPAYAKTPYEKSKFDLFAYTREAAKKFAPVLRVNAVAPGPVLPPPDPSSSEKGGATLLANRPSSGDIANAVLFLLNAGAVTGETIAVDSGQHLISGEIVR